MEFYVKYELKWSKTPMLCLQVYHLIEQIWFTNGGMTKIRW